MRRLVVCLALPALAFAGCASMPTQTPVVDRECYADYVSPTDLGPAFVVPSDQPSVRSPWDCRYQLAKASDGTVSGSLDASGCYGLDPAGSTLIYRPDFCATPPPSP